MSMPPWSCILLWCCSIIHVRLPLGLSFLFMAASIISRHLGAASKGTVSPWHDAHMAAASRAILERIPLVDFTLEIRDARIPSSSACEHVQYSLPTSRYAVILCKTDLANSSHTKKWMEHFNKQNCLCYGVNSHNKVNIQEFLQFIRTQIRKLKPKQSDCTSTVMLVGICNVGKSALANSLHQVGRISAAEKGKLKHAIVSPKPRETKDISAFKIASHPNIYVLDTPGVLAPEVHSTETLSKLTLTGIIHHPMIGEYDLAKSFLAIFNKSNEHKKWDNLMKVNVCNIKDEGKRRKQYPTDHTQDFIVNNVRQTLFETISTFKGNVEDEKDMMSLIESQFAALHDALRVESNENGCNKVASKILNLYRTGRLGRYTLDMIDGASF